MWQNLHWIDWHHGPPAVRQAQCSKKVEEQDIVLTIELLNRHDTQAHSIANKLKAFCIVSCCIEQFRDEAKTLYSCYRIIFRLLWIISVWPWRREFCWGGYYWCSRREGAVTLRPWSWWPCTKLSCWRGKWWPWWWFVEGRIHYASRG